MVTIKISLLLFSTVLFAHPPTLKRCHPFLLPLLRCHNYILRTLQGFVLLPLYVL